MRRSAAVASASTAPVVSVEASRRAASPSVSDCARSRRAPASVHLYDVVDDWLTGDLLAAFQHAGCPLAADDIAESERGEEQQEERDADEDPEQLGPQACTTMPS